MAEKPVQCVESKIHAQKDFNLISSIANEILMRKKGQQCMSRRAAFVCFPSLKHVERVPGHCQTRALRDFLPVFS